MMFLLGRHAMFGAEPPTYLRSTTTTRCPFCAEVQAISLPPAPLPRTTRSYSSGLVLSVFILCDEGLGLFFELEICGWGSSPDLAHSGKVTLLGPAVPSC